jgi:hypothetical protein
MEVNVIGRHSGKCSFVKESVIFLAKQLKIKKNNFNLTVKLHKGVRKELGAQGVAYKMDDREYVVVIDTSLSTEQVIRVLSHEMVHVKQFVRGQYRTELKRGKMLHYWQGKRYSYDNYYGAPWEIDAASKEGLLAFKLTGAWDKLAKSIENV